MAILTVHVRLRLTVRAGGNSQSSSYWANSHTLVCIQSGCYTRRGKRLHWGIKVGLPAAKYRR
jgi:hypothetical protein